MIAYVRGRLDRAVNAAEVVITTADGQDLPAQVFGATGSLAAGDHVVAATATVAIGVVDHVRTVFLGAWPAGADDPGGPLGLASTPAVLLPEPALAPIVRAGIERAGRGPSLASFDGRIEALGLELLSGTSSGADVIVVERADARQIDLVRLLGGRAVVALSGAGAVEARAWLAGAELDADIPVPSVGEGWGAMATLGLEATHHLVQVDPTPALAEAGTNATAVSADALAAAAAGVLAGRIAAGNRRWRAALEP